MSYVLGNLNHGFLRCIESNCDINSDNLKDSEDKTTSVCCNSCSIITNKNNNKNNSSVTTIIIQTQTQETFVNCQALKLPHI